jgi:hypothetical protein
MTAPNPSHEPRRSRKPKSYSMQFRTTDDYIVNRLFIFNGLEFETPFSQALHHARNDCDRLGRELAGVICAPILKIHSLRPAGNINRSGGYTPDAPEAS